MELKRIGMRAIVKCQPENEFLPSLTDGSKINDY